MSKTGSVSHYFWKWLCVKWFQKCIFGISDRVVPEMHLWNVPRYKIKFLRSIMTYNLYKYVAIIPCFFTRSHYTRMDIKWHVAYVNFNNAKSSIEFKFNEYTPLVDLKLWRISYNTLTIEKLWNSSTVHPRLIINGRFSSTTLNWRQVKV